MKKLVLILYCIILLFLSVHPVSIQATERSFGLSGKQESQGKSSDDLSEYVQGLKQDTINSLTEDSKRGTDGAESVFHALTKSRYSELTEEEKQVLREMYLVSDELLVAYEGLKLSLIDSIAIATRVTDYGMSRQEVQALLADYPNVTILDIQMKSYQAFIDRYPVDSSGQDEIRSLFLQGYEYYHIYAAYVVGTGLELPISSLVVKDINRAEAGLESRREMFTEEEGRIVARIIDQLPVRVEAVIDYMQDSDKSWLDIASEIQSVLQSLYAESMDLTEPEYMATMSSPTPPDIQYEKYFQAPFNIQQNHQESIQTGTGSLAYGMNHYSLPGRNGLDVNLSIRYDSSDSNLFETDYSYSYDYYEDYDYIVYGGALAYWSNWIGTDRIPYYDIPLFEIDTYETYEQALAMANSYASQSDIVIEGFWEDGTDLILSFYAIIEPVYDPYDSYYNEYTTNLTIPHTYIEKRHNLGAGWSFDFPSIETDSRGNKYLHLSGGGKHKIKITSTVGDSNLDQYTLKDIRIETDSGSYTNTQSVHSAYIVYYNHGYKEYFSADGRLLAQRDRYGNTISFEHTMIGGTAVLSKIIDTIQREFIFSYTTSGSSKKLTVTLPNSETIEYRSELISGYSNEYELSKIVQFFDESNRETSFQYDVGFCTGNFSYFSKSSRTKENSYACLTEITFPTSAKTVYSYEKAVANLGNTGSYEYFRIQSREEQVDSISNNKLTYEYTNNYSGYPTYHNPNSLPTAFTYAMTVKDINNTSTAYTLSNKHLIAKTESKTGSHMIEKVDYLYNTDKLPTSITTTRYNIGTSDHASKTVEMVYDAWGNVLEYTDSLQNKTFYTYDSVFKIKTGEWTNMNASTMQKTEWVVHPSTGNITQIKQHHMVSGVDKSILADLIYDSYGNVLTTKIKQQDGADVIQHFEYGANYGYAYLTRSYQNVKDVHDVTELVEQEYQYDLATGLVRYATNGEGHTSELQYDGLGRLLWFIHPDPNEKIELVYDDPNNRLTISNEMGHKQRYLYDGLGRLTKKQSFRDNDWLTEEEHHYNALSQLEWSKDVAGNTTSFQYDVLGRVIRADFADESFKQTIYSDAWLFAGGTSQIQSIDEEGHISFAYYDKLGRKTSEKLNDTVYYTYDNVGNQTSFKDAKGETTTYVYDDLSRLIQVKNPLNETTTYEYDNLNRLVKTIFPDGKHKQLIYDDAGRVIKKIDELGQFETITYDRNGNRDMAVDRKGHTMNYTFDQERNFLENITITNGTETQQKTFTYNAAGQRLTASNEFGEFVYEYREDNGVLEQVKYPDNRTVAIENSPVQSWIKITDPFGQDQYYKYDIRNRLAYVTTSTLAGANEAEYSYYANGQLKETQYANGIVAERQYDTTQASRLHKILHKPGTGSPMNAYTYGYDNNHNIVSITENVNGMVDTYSFDYDKLNRIATSDEYTEAYTYDKRGNRQTLKSERLLDISAVTYSYNLWNELVQVVKEDGTTITYAYDPDGLLYERTVDEEPTTRYYQFNAYIVAEGEVIADGTSELKARYIRGHGLIHREDANGDKQYYLTNGHGDVVEMRDEQGIIVNQYDYDLWGNPEIRQADVDNPFLYSGEFWDQAAELQYLRARWYDPSIGRFINEDTYEGELNNPLTLNLYTYVHNNPLKYIDPSGHKVEMYVGTHEVAAGRYHLSIIIFIDEESEYWNSTDFINNFDEERGMQYMTIGAGQSRALNPNLKAGINRPRDKDLSIKTDMIKLGEQEDDQELIKFLKVFDNFIENSERKPIKYVMFPISFDGGYNSNSYVTGFLQAAEYDIEKPDRILPGFGKPVPSKYFMEPEEKKKPWWQIW